MRNKIRYIRLIGLIFVLIVGSSLTFAQNKSKRKSAKKPLVEVVSIVTDEKGSPLKNVSIICGEGAVVLYTDAKGRFQTKVENDATVMVEALGYEDKVYKLTGSNIVPEKIVLKKEPLFLTEESLVNRADGGKTYKGNEVGATSVLENGQFGTFPDLTLTNEMANADFSRQQNQPTGGFDASSYRAAAPAEEEVRLTPFQQKLAGLEKALPAALGKQAVAVALCIVVMLGCFVGFGGAKLRAKYDTVKNGFTTGVAADSGYTLNEELTTRLNTAANIITTASNTLGADSAEVQTAQAALDSFSACLGAVQSDGKIHAPDSLSVYTGGRMHMLYQSNETLGAAIGQLYAKLQEQAADPMKMGAVQGQYSQFNSAQTIISNLHYNDAVQSYQKDVGGFPASVLGKLFGIQEVELFA